MGEKDLSRMDVEQQQDGQNSQPVDIVPPRRFRLCHNLRIVGHFLPPVLNMIVFEPRLSASFR
jgi:hypothetical protein